MSDTVFAAIVGVGGAVMVAVTAAITQDRMTKRVIDAERHKLAEQLAGDERVRKRDRRHDRLLEAVADLLAAADPQIAPGGDYGKACQLILRVQLLLDPNNRNEAGLQGALNRLGLCLQAYVCVRAKPLDQRSVELNALLAAQGEALEAGRRVLSIELS